MSKDARMKSLKLKHQRLQDAIHREGTRPIPNLSFLKELKVRKLRVKEELFLLESR